MADNVDDPFRNVEVLDAGQEQLGVNQIGINLTKDTRGSDDPVVEVSVVTRRVSGLLEAEFHLLRPDSLAKMAEHLTLRSNFESALQNEALIYEDENDD